MHKILHSAALRQNCLLISNNVIRWLMGTRLKHCGARCLFPVFDDATYKSVFSVSIARPKEMTVLSNMPLRTLRDA